MTTLEEKLKEMENHIPSKSKNNTDSETNTQFFFVPRPPNRKTSMERDIRTAEKGPKSVAKGPKRNHRN